MEVLRFAHSPCHGAATVARFLGQTTPTLNGRHARTPSQIPCVPMPGYPTRVAVEKLHVSL
jgi:hypothetical protein